MISIQLAASPPRQLRFNSIPAAPELVLESIAQKRIKDEGGRAETEIAVAGARCKNLTSPPETESGRATPFATSKRKLKQAVRSRRENKREAYPLSRSCA